MKNKLWYFHVVEYHAAIKRKKPTDTYRGTHEFLKHHTKSKNPDTKTTYFMIPFVLKPKKRKTVVAESRSVFAGCWK